MEKSDGRTPEDIVNLIKFFLGRSKFRNVTTDLLHQIIVEILEKQHKYDEKRSKWSTYIVNSARWSALSNFTKQNKLARNELCIDEINPEGEKTMMYEIIPALDIEDRNSHLNKQIKKLDGLQQTVIILKFYENVPIKQIADLLGMKRTSIEHALKSAIAELRNELEAEDVL